MRDINDTIKMKKCTVCGKEFVYQPSWVYKTRNKQGKPTKYQCSYTCWRKAGEGQNATRRYAKKSI